MNPKPGKPEAEGDGGTGPLAASKADNSIRFLDWRIVLVLALLGVLLWRSMSGFLSHSTNVVIVYTSQDQVFAEPIFQEFTRETGIQVRAVFDSEAVKTVGLANRLLAERNHPRCDLFWSNEELRTRQLAAQGLFRDTNGWAAFGSRSRRLAMRVGQTNVPPPRSWRDLTNAVYRGKIAMAYPLFGTTCTHWLALRQSWGESNWLAWCRALVANAPWIVDGNSVAARWVSQGKVEIGMTDSDDIAAEIREGERIHSLELFEDSLLIPNTVAVLRQAPHPASAEKLFQYLQSNKVRDRLIAAEALEKPIGTPNHARTIRPDWERLLSELDRATEQIRQVFRR